ncbi:endonuclease/exonuclease/phosphatase family protein [Yoonia vestfoldensis]|uniref:endonuclease/exonuclease/phosphatase family protein n=1 Tax=Yoonia vestfoldensis TaxID=245188 RepID=UPI001FDEEA3B|nr:endonuclease/exonuclease/phosphatase family protein [Yoonia vestfoldensis]
MPVIICATWNIHRAKGRDGRVDPGRVAEAITRDLSPLGRQQVLALQEADGECPPHAGILDLERIEAETGLRHVHRDAHMRWGPQSHGFLGSILFLDPAITVTALDVIDLPGHCHRGAVVVETLQGGVACRIMTMHLSLSQPLRIVQMRIIGQYLRRRPAMQTLLLGDLNEWRPWSGLAFSRRLLGRQFAGGVRRTFPAHRPLLPLDRILSDRAGAVQDLQVVDTPAIRAASDHLPLTARVALA